MDEQLNKIPAGLRLKSILGSVLPIECITLALIVFGCACVAANSSDQASRYLTDSASATALLIILVAAIILPALSLIVYRGEGVSVMPLAAKLFSILPSGASLYAAYFTYICRKKVWNDVSVSPTGKTEDFLQILMPACAVLTAAFFILKIAERFEILKFICSLGVFAFATLVIASLYLDFSIELNSPYKLSVQFAAVAIMLGTMADMRQFLLRTGAGRFVYLKTLALICSLLASGLLFTSHFNGADTLPESYFVYSVLFICYAVSVCAELAAQTVTRVKSFI